MSESSNSGGIGFFGLLAVVFITLKLTGVVHWNWLWVLAPIWAPIAVALLVVLIGAVLMLVFDR